MKILKEDFYIEDMYASAWQAAIENVGNILNKELGLNLQVTQDDWRQVERIADALKIRFDENGEII